MIYRLVPRPSRFEIRQFKYKSSVIVRTKWPFTDRYDGSAVVKLYKRRPVLFYYFGQLTAERDFHLMRNLWELMEGTCPCLMNWQDTRRNLSTSFTLDFPLRPVWWIVVLSQALLQSSLDEPLPVHSKVLHQCDDWMGPGFYVDFQKTIRGPVRTKCKLKLRKAKRFSEHCEMIILASFDSFYSYHVF